MTIDDSFNEMHPPKMVDRDTAPPLKSQELKIGKDFKIESNDFDRVHDPDYAWENMNWQDPIEKAKRDEERQKKFDEVSHYIMRRVKYWTRDDNIEYSANAKEVRVLISTGTTIRDESIKTERTSQRIGVQLGIDIPGNLFNPTNPGEIPPVEAAATMAMDEGDEGASGGGDSLANAQFTWEMSHELEFQKIHETTYSKTVEKEVTEQYRADTTYITWQMTEEITFHRILNNSTTELLISNMVAQNGRYYIDGYPPPIGDDDQEPD